MKRVLMVGCSHGRYVDKAAASAVVGMAKRFKPYLIVHLGDWSDCTCLRGGASGSSDEAVRIRPDIDGGLEFIARLRKYSEEMWVFDGNHEARLFRFLHSPKARDAELAELLLDQIGDRMKEMGVRHIPYRGIWEVRKLGNYTLLHGAGMGGLNSLQQHVNYYGNVVIAHIHAPHVCKATRCDNATGFSVGTLCDIQGMDYAANRFNTGRWGAGFVWGKFNEKRAQLWLHSQPMGQKEWVLPI